MKYNRCDQVFSNEHGPELTPGALSVADAELFLLRFVRHTADVIRSVIGVVQVRFIDTCLSASERGACNGGSFEMVCSKLYFV